MTSQSEELAALEAKLRETEERLARAARAKELPAVPKIPQEYMQESQASRHQAYSGAQSVPRSGQQAQQPFADEGYASGEMNESSTSTRPYNVRGDSLNLPPMPGAMPQTPTGQEYGRNKFVAVDRTR